MEDAVMKKELRNCPQCGGDVKLMANPFHKTDECACFARCSKCKKEYGLPNVKLKILKNLRVSKTTLRESAKAWNLEKLN